MKWSYPDVKGKFGPYGGRFVPDTLMAACSELESAYAKARRDRSFWKEFKYYNDHFAGRPTPLFLAGRLTPRNVGALVTRVRPFGVDACSGTEKSPGVKDPAKIRDFIQTARQAHRESTKVKVKIR